MTTTTMRTTREAPRRDQSQSHDSSAKVDPTLPPRPHHNISPVFCFLCSILRIPKSIFLMMMTIFSFWPLSRALFRPLYLGRGIGICLFYEHYELSAIPAFAFGYLGHLWWYANQQGIAGPTFSSSFLLLRFVFCSLLPIRSFLLLFFFLLLSFLGRRSGRLCSTLLLVPCGNLLEAKSPGGNPSSVGIFVQKSLGCVFEISESW